MINKDKGVSSHEEIRIHGRTNRLRIEAGRDRYTCPRDMPKNGYLQTELLPLEKEIYRMGVPEVRGLNILEQESQKLKQLVAGLSPDKQMLQDVLRKSF